MTLVAPRPEDGAAATPLPCACHTQCRSDDRPLSTSRDDRSRRQPRANWVSEMPHAQHVRYYEQGSYWMRMLYRIYP